MENGDIPDENIEAYGTTSRCFPTADDCKPQQARLNGLKSWIGDSLQQPPFVWIQADIGYQTSVSGVVTQGNGNTINIDWVSSIKVSTFSTSTDDEEVFVKDEQGEVIVSKKNHFKIY